MALHLNDILKLLNYNNPFVDKLAEICLESQVAANKAVPNSGFNEKTLSDFKQAQLLETQQSKSYPKEYQNLHELTENLLKTKEELKLYQAQQKAKNEKLDTKIIAQFEFTIKDLENQRLQIKELLQQNCKAGYDVLEKMRNHARFLIASIMVEKLFTGGFKSKITDPVKLLFSALFKQARLGDCIEPKPKFNFAKPIETATATAKWNAYNALKGKSLEQAKIEYLTLGMNTLETLQADPKNQETLSQVCESLMIPIKVENMDRGTYLKMLGDLTSADQKREDLFFLCFRSDTQALAKLATKKKDNTTKPVLFSSKLNVQPSPVASATPETNDKKDQKSQSAPGPDRSNTSNIVSPTRKLSGPT